MIHKITHGDCEIELDKLKDLKFFKGIHLSFLDPPFNQNKDYNLHNDDMPEEEYWAWMKRVCKKIFDLTVKGGAIYFMQREKNTEFVLQTLRKTGWSFQNLIAWNKLTSAIPSKYRFSKKYQIIAYFTKGNKPLTFNNLRYEPPLLAMHEYERETGMYVTDIWDDIRELTSGYFAGDEAIRTQNGKIFTKEGERFHKQQTPVELLTRIILSSSKVGDFVLDPFAGTGVTSIVAKQLKRNSISIELDPQNVKLINKRLEMMRDSDRVDNFFSDYIYTENLDKIWYGEENNDMEKSTNYKHQGISKVKINNVFLMKETIKNVLTTNLKLPEDIIDFNYKIKDNENNIRKFELVIHVKPKNNIILRLIYAKSIQQADLWIKRIKKENEVINNQEPDSIYYVVLSGIAFKEVLSNQNNQIDRALYISFPGWESLYKLPSLIEKLTRIDLIKNLKKSKQLSLNLF